MTDQELRSKLLSLLYSERAEEGVKIGMNAFNSPEAKEQIRIASQLKEYGLIEFRMLNRQIGGLANITAAGVDVVEGTAQSPIAVTIDRRQTINVSGSSGIQIGDGNTLAINQGIEAIASHIKSSDAPHQEKEEAKTLLRRLLEHPLIAAVAGGAVGLLG